MSFDATVQPIGIDLSVPSEEQIKEGANALQVNVTLGQVLPFSPGPGQPPLVIPSGVIRFPVGREQALNLAEKLQEEGEKLPKQSSIITANSLEGIDQAADFQKNLRG